MLGIDGASLPLEGIRILDFSQLIARPSPWPLILMQRLKVHGFIVTDFAAGFPEASMQLAQWWMGGQLKAKVDVRHGLENAVSTVRDLYTGGNFGKLLLEVKAPAA